jgi:transketolase
MSSYTDEQVRRLEEIARRLKIQCLEMIHRRGAGHPGGSLSAADVLTALYFHKLRIDPARPDWPDRDRFILSKGHASALLYAALAERGFFPREDLQRWGSLDCHLQGHPERMKTPGVDMTTGLLGHGINVGAGLALGARSEKKSYRTYVLLGDGECQCGVIWEGAMTAGKYGLANLTLIVDVNGVQLDGFVHEIMPVEPLADKWRAFGLGVLEIDGHNMRQILEALDMVDRIHDRTMAILARTVKGHGVSYMENDHAWHGGVPNERQLEQARQELAAGSGP